MVVSWSSGPVDISPYITMLLKESRFTGSPHLRHEIQAYLMTCSHYAICILPLLLCISLSEVYILLYMCKYIPLVWSLVKGWSYLWALHVGTVKCSQAFEDCIGIVYHYQDIIYCVWELWVLNVRLWSLLHQAQNSCLSLMSLWCNAMLCAMLLR